MSNNQDGPEIMPYVTNVAKFVLGMGIIGLVLWKFQIVELLSVFAVIVMVPMMFLASVGLVGQSTIDTVRHAARDFGSSFNKKMEELRREGREQAKNQKLDDLLKVG